METFDNSINFVSMLDAKDKRRKALEILRDKMLILLINYIEEVYCDHPAYMKESQENAKKKK